MKTTIVFRGLMVLHKQADTMEIGFIDARDGHSHNYQTSTSSTHTAQGCGSAVTTQTHQQDQNCTSANQAHQGCGCAPSNQAQGHDQVATSSTHADHGSDYGAIHIPRILTIKNGVLSSIFDLRNRPELGTVRNWSLVVTKPKQPETRLHQQTPFDRSDMAPGDETDFRWIADLEGSDLHARDLSLEINTRNLLFVLYVANGTFYTRLKSPVLRRRRLNSSSVEPYGPTAAVVGCDIEFDEGGGVALVAGGANGAIVFNFDHEEGTVYEISNGPPDVPMDRPVSLDERGHFHMYYEKLFDYPCPDQFDLLTEDQAPAPDPTLCGAVYLGTRPGPL